MLFTRQRWLSALLLVGLACLPAFAQTATPKDPPTAPKEKEPEYVEHKDFKSKIIEFKHRNPYDLMRVVTSMGSGAKGTKLTVNEHFKTLTVRDYPENIATIEDAIKRLDVPEPPRKEVRFPDIEITAYVLIASKQESPVAQYPAPLKDVVVQLQNTLGFKSYQLLTPIVQRTGSNSGNVSSNGVAPLTLANQSFSGRYGLQLEQMEAENRNQPEASGIVIRRLKFMLQCDPSDPTVRKRVEVNISTNLTVKNGEKVVVGTASLEDSALVLVIMAKWIN